MADYRKHLIVGKKISVKVHINAKRSCGFHSSCQVTLPSSCSSLQDYIISGGFLWIEMHNEQVL